MRRTIGVEVQARGEDLGDLWRGHHRRKRQPVANACAEVPGEPWAVCVAPVDEWLVVSRRQMAAVREAIEASGL